MIHIFNFIAYPEGTIITITGSITARALLFYCFVVVKGENFLKTIILLASETSMKIDHHHCHLQLVNPDIKINS